ncbi:MAG: DEAD/DEAH box helicase [Candidatus Nomurabacteria bacterium]|nr:DEAD/DEAH box helicase [Candidatus Nomurabacteria bacterium]
MLKTKKNIYAGEILPPPFLPFDYQVPIIKIMTETILNGENGLVVQPTATGKSVEASFVARNCILIHKMKGLYLYDENEGVDQARKRFELILGENKVRSANFFGYGKDDFVTEADMVFASFQSLNNQYEKWYLMFNQEHFDFIIVNEAHGGQAVTYKEVIDYFICSKIGMTATPERMDGKNILDIFDKVIYEITLEEAIAKNMIADIEYHICSHGLSTQKLKQICKEVLEEGKRISIKQLNETIFIDSLDESVFEEIFKYAFPENDEPRQTLIFCENIIHAERVFDKLKEKGKNVEVIHSKMGKSHNRKVMENFRANKVQFLVSINKLNEDIDVPSAEIAVFLRATDSLTVFLQQLGRPLRKLDSKRKAIYLDFVANVERLIFVRNLMDKVVQFSQTLEKLGNQPIFRDKLNVSGKGFDFRLTDDLVDVLDLIKALKEGYYETWQEASSVIMLASIRSQEEYKKCYRRISLQLHSNPQMIYTDFPGWKVFLGTKYQTWQDASVACKKLGILSSSDYERIRNFRLEKRDSKLPKNPEIFYSDFPGWKNFLGFRSPKKGWIPWDIFIKKNGKFSSIEIEISLSPEIIDNRYVCFFWKDDRAVKYVLESKVFKN